MSLLTNLVGYWNLDEASGNAIDAHAAFDLTDVNTVGAAEGGRDFEVSNAEWFAIADNATLSVNGDVDWGVFGWVKFESNGTYQGLISKWHEDTSSKEFAVYYEQAQNKLAFVVSSDGTTNTASVLSTSTLSTATWYFFVAWVDTVANTINLQVNNGTVQSSAFSVGVFNGSADLRIGDFRVTGSDLSLDGIAKSFGIMKGAYPTADERTFLYNNGTPLKYVDLFVSTFPLEFSVYTSGASFLTTVTTSPTSGYEQRIKHRERARDHGNAALAVKTITDAHILRNFFLNRGGRFESFLLKDVLDYTSDRVATADIGTGALTTFQIRKAYTDLVGNIYYRNIYRPISGTVSVWVNNVLKTSGTDYSVNYNTGIITFVSAPANGHLVEVETDFYKVMRFDTDSLDMQTLIFYVNAGTDRGLIQPPDIPVIEVF